MKVDVLDALLASALLFGVGGYMFWLNKMIFRETANVVFGHFQIQGAEDERRIMEEEDEDKDEDEDEDEDLPGRVLRVQVIDDVGKKCH